MKTVRSDGVTDSSSPVARVRVESTNAATGAREDLASSAQAKRAALKDTAGQRLIRVRGAKEHNLKNISVDIPRDQLVVITGLSGSGKSSLAFDTIFAEGQRKYMESLSAYARQFLEQLKKPDVEEIEGIPPTIAIEQRSAASNPRSTVATTTEIYDYLRLLYARCATPYSWAPTKTKKDGTILERAGTPIAGTSSTQIVDTVMGWNAGQRLMVLAPVVRGKKGFHRDVLEEFTKQGWTRARVNGALVDIREVLKDSSENPLKLGRYEKHSIEAVIDRLVLGPEARQRLAESIEAALRMADGAVVIAREATPEEAKELAARASENKAKGSKGDSDASASGAGGSSGSVWIDHAFSTKLADPERPEFALEEVSPRLFSFNSPFGACKKCDGLGTLLEFDPLLVVPNDNLSLADGAVVAWAKNGPVRAWFNRKLKRFCRDFGASYDVPFKKLDPEHRRILLHGSTPADQAKFDAKFEGVIPNITEWWGSTENPGVKEWLGGFLSQTPCTECMGDRLRIEALHVLLTSTHPADTGRAFSASVIGRPRPAGSTPGKAQIADGTLLNIAELSRLTISDAAAFVSNLVLTREQAHIAEPILKEINNRLRFLAGVGLEYLSLDRKTATLSGGEAQRIRLASQVGSGLVGACYVLDEPTIGLHQRDNTRLISTLRHLTDIGNSVLVVEHDEDMIRAADHVLDIGPGPGVHGGRVVAQGTVDEICRVPESLTGAYLSGRKKIEIPRQRRSVSEKKAICVKGARENNLKGVDAIFPLGGIVCVTGVSGSGKSTLVNDILLQAAKIATLGSRVKVGAHSKITGLQNVDRIVEVDQSPIGRTPRSNPATYTGFFDDIRAVFTQTKEAKIRGYKPGRFSFNVSQQNGGGRCEACQGQGLKKIEMHFLPDVYVQCEVCAGKRYNRETLEITYKGKSIADVLDMTVENALEYFTNHPKVVRFLQCLHDVGLDYVQLGQPSTQLSGGEAQRIKLATELGKTGGTKNDPLGSSGGALAASPVSRLEPHSAAENGEVSTGQEARATKGRAAPEGDRRPAGGNTLYILDEPTTGLHFEDIAKLVAVFDRLADAGNTLVVIEHNLDVIKRADWIIDLGPEGGDNGGRIVASGTPEQVAKIDASHTGRYLRQMLG
ncbi:MAG: excinuclease ABC subunit UvrA [Planctomycetota bacterium]|nr:excinuclease ABC subunit UvrA [Planctomycetota bacterium]